MDSQILHELGFTPAEAKVYLTLLELGSAMAGPILDKTGLQNSVVHFTLNRLIEKGLVSYVREGKRHRYQATNPQHILQLLEEKKERFAHLLPRLLIQQQKASSKPEVTTFRGKTGIKELLYDLLEAGGKEHHTLNSPRESLTMGDHFWLNYHLKRAEKGIRARQILNESLRDWIAEMKYKLAQVRYTRKGFEPLTETIIRNDKVGILIWAEKPIGILIHNKTIAESYDRYFELLWKQAKP